MESFQNELKDLLVNGWNVELGDIGYFSVSLQGPPVMEKKEVRSPSIRVKNVNLRPGKLFKRELASSMRLELGESITHSNGNDPSEEACIAAKLEHLEKYPCISRADCCRLTGRDKKRALKELNAFVERGVLMCYGGGRQVVYAKKSFEIIE